MSSDQRLSACRLAEQMVAGAVGRSLSTAEIHRLEEHAAYCRDCRRTMKGWRTGALGLAVCLERAPLPQALKRRRCSAPRCPIAGAAGAVGRRRAKGMLAWIGRAATSRAAAYGLAAVCLTVAFGLAVMHPE